MIDPHPVDPCKGRAEITESRRKTVRLEHRGLVAEVQALVERSTECQTHAVFTQEAHGLGSDGRRVGGQVLGGQERLAHDVAISSIRLDVGSRQGMGRRKLRQSQFVAQLGVPHGIALPSRVRRRHGHHQQQGNRHCEQC